MERSIIGIPEPRRMLALGWRKVHCWTDNTNGSVVHVRRRMTKRLLLLAPGAPEVIAFQPSKSNSVGAGAFLTG